MKKFLLSISILMSFMLVNLTINAQDAKECEVEDPNPPKETQAYEHINQYLSLEAIPMPDDPEYEEPEFEGGLEANPIPPADNTRSTNSTTVYYNMTTLNGYTYNYQGLSFSPYIYGSYGNYSYNWQPTTITLPEGATSVTVNAYGRATSRYWYYHWWGSHYHYYNYYGVRLLAYNANGNYLGSAYNYSYGYSNITFNAPAGQEIAYFVIQTRYNGNYTNYTYVRHIWATYPQTNQAPVAIAQDVSADAGANCDAAVTASQIDNGSYDPDGDAITLSVSPAGPYPLGQTSVTLTVSDGELSSTATATVTVNDVTAPIPDLPSLADVTGECDATVASAPTATDNCAGALTATTSDPLYYDQQGTYTITWTFDDGNGNTTTQTQSVIVDDITAPVADVPVLADVTGECDATVASAPTATDNCAGALAATTSDPLYYDQQGTYTVTWTFDDGNGNTTTQSQSVIVDDVTAPVADVPVLADVTGECDATVTSVPTATDNCTGALTATTSDPLYYDQQGTYTVTWTFDDGNGNTTTQTQNVIVDDVTAPVITANSNVTKLWPPNHKYETINVLDCFTGVSDNCVSLSDSDVIITKVTSDEEEDANGNGDGNTTDDIVIASDCKSVDLRKERAGNGNGRVYTIHMEVDDGNGNIGTATYEVHVPKNRNGNAVNDGANYEEVGNCSAGTKELFTGSHVDEAVFKAYPNPTNNIATIEIMVPETGLTSVVVYNSFGTKVAVLHNGTMDSGVNTKLTFNGSNLTKGVYYIRMQTKGHSETMKLILTK